MIIVLVFSNVILMRFSLRITLVFSWWKNKSKTAKPRKFPGDIHKFFIIKKIFKFGLPRTYSFSGDRTPFGIRKKSRYRRIGDYGGLSITSNWRLHHDDKYLFCYLYCGLAILVIQKTLQKLYITKRILNGFKNNGLTSMVQHYLDKVWCRLVVCQVQMLIWLQ